MSCHTILGFTLIELMVVLAVVGILLLIAVPAFTDQVRRGHRTEALAAVQTIVLGQERWRANRATYGAAADVGAPGSTEGGHYNLAVSNNTATGYTITATPQGTQASDRCGTLTYTFNGTAAANSQVSKSPAGCW